MVNQQGEMVSLTDTASWCSQNWQNKAQDVSPCKIRQISSSGILSSYDPDKQTITLEWERPFNTGGKYDLEFGQELELVSYYGMFNSDGEEDKKRLEGGEKSVVIRLNQNNNAAKIFVTIQLIFASMVYFF